MVLIQIIKLQLKIDNNRKEDFYIHLSLFEIHSQLDHNLIMQLLLKKTDLFDNLLIVITCCISSIDHRLDRFVYCTVYLINL